MEAMIRFVVAYRDDHGVEPICRVLEIAPSTYHAHARRRSQPQTAPARVQRDVELMQEIRRVFDENFQVFGNVPPAETEAAYYRELEEPTPIAA